MVSRFVPDSGDIIWIDFNPQSGQEQSGHRPALVLSPFAYNVKSGLCIVCPITSQIKGYPFEVSGIELESRESVVLADHVKSLDWRARKAKKAGKAPNSVLLSVAEIVSALIGCGANESGV